MARSTSVMLALGFPCGLLLAGQSASGSAVLDAGLPQSLDDSATSLRQHAGPPVGTFTGRSHKVLAAQGIPCIWDNGPPDGVNGYSNATPNVFGSRRSLLDDFIVPDGEIWEIEDFHWSHTWNTLPPGTGSGVELTVWLDDVGAPGAPIAQLNVIGYSEEGTGQTFFNRAETVSWASYEHITLAPGTYWMEWTIIGPENNFSLTAARNNTSECWVDYADFGGLQPGSNIFGAEADLSWCLTGTIILPGGGACCFDDGSCVNTPDEPRCNVLGGEYQGDGTNCDDIQCQIHFGACCFDIDCVELFRRECFDNGGDYQGDGVRCDPNPCIPGIGACCLEQQCFDDVPQKECEAAGGTYQGDDTTCADCDCARVGACCLPPVPGPCGPAAPNPECIVTTFCHCVALGGQYLGDGVPCEQIIIEPIHTSTQWTHKIRVVSKCADEESDDGCVEGPYQVDPWVTSAGDALNCEDFGSPDACPIPADFFSAGSDPFDGSICFCGVPLGNVQLPGFPDPLNFGEADTLIRRSADPFDRCEVPFGETRVVEIEIVALSLVSTQPIVVTENGGQNPTLWDVDIIVDPSQQPGGQLAATKEHCNGGTFDSILAVCPKFVFTNVQTGEQRELDFCQECNPGGIVMEAQDVPWVHDAGANYQFPNPVCTQFIPGVAEANPTNACDCDNNRVRDDCDPPGACCLPPVPTNCGPVDPDPACVPLSFCECIAAGGVFLGEGVPCEQRVRQPIHTATQWTHIIKLVSNCPGDGDLGCFESEVKIDPWLTAPSNTGGNCENFGSPDACPIPADFFCAGSQPFTGEICFCGVPIGPINIPGLPPGLDFGPADTLIRRFGDPFDDCEVPFGESRTVPIEIVALSLQSLLPIQVEGCPPGQDLWDVRVEINPNDPQPGGLLKAILDHCNGGRFSSVLAACPRFVFTNVATGQELTLDYCKDCDPEGIVMETLNQQWVREPGVNLALPNPVCTNFYPGVEEINPTQDCDCNENGQDDSCEQRGDATGDGCVNFEDILLILANWGNAGGPGDVNCSGSVDFADILLVLAEFGNGPNCP